MSETLINPIKSVRLSEPGTTPKSTTQVQAETSTTHRSVVPEPDRSFEQTEITVDKAGNSSDVSIHFRLDDKTKELTVFVVDKKSKRVLRSIPASELHKLKAGELLRLTA